MFIEITEKCGISSTRRVSYLSVGVGADSALDLQGLQFVGPLGLGNRPACVNIAAQFVCGAVRQ